MVDGVIEAPGGAHFTECPPDYDRDEVFQREYAATAKDPAAWESFREKYLELGSEAEYQAAVAER
jgi:glutaconate CoA-transferase subunit A